jgi:hypothetical protein
MTQQRSQKSAFAQKVKQPSLWLDPLAKAISRKVGQVVSSSEANMSKIERKMGLNRLPPYGVACRTRRIVEWRFEERRQAECGAKRIAYSKNASDITKIGPSV